MATLSLLPPDGMTTEAGAKRCSEALEDLTLATGDVANYFQQLWDEGAIAAGLNFDETEEAGRCLKARQEAQEEFLRAVAGIPAVGK